MSFLRRKQNDKDIILVILQRVSVFLVAEAGFEPTSCCGARRFGSSEPHLSTAATPFSSLHLPQAALGNVPFGNPRSLVKSTP